MKRRDFIRNSSAALAGASLLKLDRIPNLHRFAAIGVPGVQLYTVRDHMEHDVRATLTKVAEIGYKEVEFAGYFGHDPAEIRGWLDELEISAPSGHVGFEGLSENTAAEIASAKILGFDYVIVPGVPGDMRDSIDAYTAFAAALNKLGAACAEAEVGFAFHNHDYEFAPIDGVVPYDVIAGETDPDLVDLEMDLFWTVVGGHNPVEYFEKYAGRVKLCHVKDRASDGSMVDVGSGEIDFAEIFGHAETAGLKHFVVEHDNPEDSFASIAASYTTVTELLD